MQFMVFHFMMLGAYMRVCAALVRDLCEPCSPVLYLYRDEVSLSITPGDRNRVRGLCNCCNDSCLMNECQDTRSCFERLQVTAGFCYYAACELKERGRRRSVKRLGATEREPLRATGHGWCFWTHFPPSCLLFCFPSPLATSQRLLLRFDME